MRKTVGYIFLKFEMGDSLCIVLGDSDFHSYCSTTKPSLRKAINGHFLCILLTGPPSLLKFGIEIVEKFQFSAMLIHKSLV
jgi:hypothetical protein